MERNLIIERYQQRYATKKFNKNKVVSEEDFAIIKEVARLSPSSFGFEPWLFVHITDSKVLNELSKLAWGARNSIEGASHIVLAFARKNVAFDSKYIDYIINDVKGLDEDAAKQKKEVVENFQKNDFNLNDEASLLGWATNQTYIALGNMLSVAAELGIDSCAIEGFNKQEVNQLLAKQQIIDANEFSIVYMAGFGYRDEAITPKTRRNLKEVFIER